MKTATNARQQGEQLYISVLYSYAGTITDKPRSLKILLGTGQIK
ncbi:MAG: hypothetical protein ACR2IS_10655 [Nitrososphaeraceae archaeon]